MYIKNSKKIVIKFKIFIR